MKLLMVRYCAEVLKLKRVELKTDVLNLPARNALLKMGFIEEGILRSHTQMTHNRRRDTIYYSLLEREFEGFLEGDMR
jgi:RimJ/RimL family protein N-acetyltransferase